MPSWVYQLEKYSFATGFGARLSNADCLVGPPGRAIYNAGGIAPGKALWREEEGRLVLKVQGFVLDIVWSVEEACTNGVIPKGWLEVATSVAEERVGGRGCIDGIGKITSIPDTLLRTIVADRDGAGQPAPSWYRRACEEAFRMINLGGEAYGELDT